jgi:hypothetical protein
MRYEILDQICSRFICQTSNLDLVVSLLKQLVAEWPHAMTLFVGKIKDVLDVLPDLDIRLAKKFLDSIRPLILLNKDFSDSLMLIFRKLSFAR